MQKIEKYHFIGIGGIGMSGLARILLKKNMCVSGSDLTFSYVTEGLSQAGAQVFQGHSSKNLPEGATVIYSSDIKHDNPEFQAALDSKVQMMHRSDLLLHLMRGYKTLAVSGTHGKTTTSALLTWVLKEAEKDPAFAVGGMIPQFQSNAGYGEGEFFVAEADESDGTFLKYKPFGAIVTNIDSDHLSHYSSMPALVEAFQQFLRKVDSPEHLFWCGDDSYLQKLLPSGISYGFSQNCQLRIIRFSQKGWSLNFDVEFKGKRYANIELALSGKHNALNGAAVFGLALNLGINESEIRKAFLSFGGIVRRCEKKGEVQNILFLDDYAHHPTEIETTLQGIRQAIGSRRLIAVFQPHRYTRTKDCQGLYQGIFDSADEVFITEIYGAGEPPIAGISSADIIQEIEKDQTKKCRYVPRLEISSVMGDFLQTHDVVVTMGAGDITKLSHEIIHHFKVKAPKKLKVGILFGGRSTEHEVTLLSARHICDCASQDIYDVQLFGITRQGRWIVGPESMQRLKENLNNSEENLKEPLMSREVLTELLSCDVFVPVFHGPYGEDGIIQGFFETLDKAYAGADHASAAICMDKALTKYLMQAQGVATLPFIDLDYAAWKKDPASWLKLIEEQLRFPVFVKPVHLGSTVGVQKVEQPDQLKDGLQKAFQFDYKLIVEQGLSDHRELEFAVLGNEEAIVFPPGEILANGLIYDYEAKYGPNGITAIPLADLQEEKIQEGMKLALKAYKNVGCTGMARVDFFLDANQKFWLNEINPIPGFTSISLYPKMCEVNGIPGKELLNLLVQLALERKRRNTVLCRSR